MRKLTEIRNELKTIEQLSVQDLTDIKGGNKSDDKRRQRPGGGTSTTSPSIGKKLPSLRFRSENNVCTPFDAFF